MGRCVVQVTIHAAKTNLSKLIEAALAGEDVVIARGDQPVVRLVPVQQKRRFVYDILADEVAGPIPDFIEPMDEQDLKQLEDRGDQFWKR